LLERICFGVRFCEEIPWLAWRSIRH
jgi:hypothetical protein